MQIRGQAGSTPCLGTVDGNLTFSSGLPDTAPSTGYLCQVSDGLKCDGASASCKAMTPIGGACTNNFYDCVTSAYCDVADHKCKVRVPVVGSCKCTPIYFDVTWSGVKFSTDSNRPIRTDLAQKMVLLVGPRQCGKTTVALIHPTLSCAVEPPCRCCSAL